MPYVRYPFAVKYQGTEYQPGAVIEVPDASGHILRGAVEIKRSSGRRKTDSAAKTDADKTEN